VINCGMSCQYQDKQLVPLDQLDPWVQDALDLIEFANGPAASPWGAKRAAMGHPEPFQLKYLGVGNEQWGTNYFERYLVFQKAIKAKHPAIALITTSGPGVDDTWWNLAWDRFNSGTPAEIVDEHYYRPPRWFYDHAGRYDLYHRKGPKVFAGEFAAHDSGRRSNLRCALAEAAFMTGLLRNADLVVLSSYAPLFARDGYAQWAPNLIWFDNTRIHVTPSYHVQALFGRHRPDVVLASKLELPAVPEKVYAGKCGVGTWNTRAEFKDIVVTKGGQTLWRADFTNGLEGWATSNGKWEAAGGTLRQEAIESDVRALAGEASWTDYTLSLKARKLAGDEGFMIYFQCAGDDSLSCWNIGGWGNTEHGLELAGATPPRARGRIELNRWYHVRIELAGESVKCHLDGRLVHDFTRKPPPALFAVAGRDRRAGELILDVVNSTEAAVTAEIALRGIRQVAAAEAFILTSASLDDTNSFDAPDRVAPRREALTLPGAVFPHVFPPRSFTILRVKGE
jgi:alpha-L-arabinofuranosidase